VTFIALPLLLASDLRTLFPIQFPDGLVDTIRSKLHSLHLNQTGSNMYYICLEIRRGQQKFVIGGMLLRDGMRRIADDRVGA
jgi:hypothetical protein